MICDEFNDVMSERKMGNSDEELDEYIIGNPIHGYKMVKRFAIGLKKMEQNLQEDD